jgi:hypothetical protein
LPARKSESLGNSLKTSEWTSKLTSLSNGWSLAFVVLALVAMIGVSMWAVMVLVRMLYIEDALSDSVDMLSDRSRSSDSASESVEYGAAKFDDR